MTSSPSSTYLRQNPGQTFEGILYDAGFEFSEAVSDPEALTTQGEIGNDSDDTDDADSPYADFRL